MPDDQKARTRGFIAEHVLRGHEASDAYGCLVCQAFDWGQESAGLSKLELQTELEEALRHARTVG